MTVELNIQYPVANWHVSAQLLRRHATRLMKELGVSDYGLSILLTNDEEISWFNSHYRHREGATNVLSFPSGDSNGNEPTLSSLSIKELGDIIISLDTAAREATELNQTIHTRLTWLIIHGLLHLTGYDHERSKEEATRMAKKEKQLLTRLEQTRSNHMTHLAINVDHIATIRQARGINEPDPIAGAAICELAGAAGIVVHLREDRRHIQDRDVYLLRQTVKTKLNLEMGANKEIIDIALDVKPDMITLVPEKRKELTTEGGLNVAAQKKKLANTIAKMDKAGIPVSIFIDPDKKQIKASHDIGATFVEIHTGRYCDAKNEKKQNKEFQLISRAAEVAFEMGLRVNAGHGLDYLTTSRVAALDTIEELSIGHAIITRAVFTGLDQAVREMKEIIETADRINS